MLEAAQYFQAREDTIDKSVLLYHRAGNLAKAIELVFNYRRFGALENLVEELDKDTDVNVLTRCADFFLENNRHAKAAYLFLLSKEVHITPSYVWCMQSRIQYLEHSFHLLRRADSEHVSRLVIFTINGGFTTQNGKQLSNPIHIQNQLVELV